MTWEVWKQRNRVIFDYVEKSTWRVSNKGIGSFREYHSEKEEVGKRNTRLWNMRNYLVMGYFDGVVQEDRLYCGTGGLLCIREACIFELRMGGGHGTNNIGEILGLWMMLYFARLCQINNPGIFVESKIILEWGLDRGSM